MPDEAGTGTSERSGESGPSIDSNAFWEDLLQAERDDDMAEVVKHAQKLQLTCCCWFPT